MCWYQMASAFGESSRMPLRLSGHKYKAKATTVDGIRFASTKEAARYAELKLLVLAGEIHRLELQTVITLHVQTKTIGTYRADFSYCECRRPTQCNQTKWIVEDVKGFKTPLYRWKRKHVMAQYGIEIKEV